MPRQPFTEDELFELFQNIVMNVFHIHVADYSFRQLPPEIEVHINVNDKGEPDGKLRTKFVYFDVKIQGVSESLFENNFEKMNKMRLEIASYLKVKQGRILKLTGNQNNRFVYLKVEFKSDEEVE